MTPLIIEAALNGTTSKARNPNTPKSPQEIADDALACLAAGAAIIHTHTEGFKSSGDAAVEEYVRGWTPVLAARPRAILYGTVANGRTPEERFGHYRGLARAGMRMGTIDPGSVNLATHGEDGLPGSVSFVYRTSFKDIAALIDLLAECRLGPSIAIYEPGFLRTTLAYEKAGRLPADAEGARRLSGDAGWLSPGLGRLGPGRKHRRQRPGSRGHRARRPCPRWPRGLLRRRPAHQRRLGHGGG